MEDWSQHLLSKKKLDQLYYLIRSCEQCIKQNEGQWELIGRYWPRLWFQRLMHMSEEELLEKYRYHAEHIIRAEEDLEIHKRALYMHNSAVEALHKSMKPYEKINLKHVTLVQQELF